MVTETKWRMIVLMPCERIGTDIVVEDGPGGGKRNSEREEQMKLAHYFSRYEAHKHSAKLEEKLVNKHKAEVSKTRFRARLKK